MIREIFHERKITFNCLWQCLLPFGQTVWIQNSAFVAFPSAIGGVSSLIEDEKFDFDVPLSPIDFDVR